MTCAVPTTTHGLTTLDQSDDTYAILMHMMTGYWMTQTMQAAARLGLFDALRDQPRTATDLARTCLLNPQTTHRLVRTLVAFGLLDLHENGAVSLTTLGDGMCLTNPHSLATFAMALCDPWCWTLWGDAAETIRTGQTLFTREGYATAWAWMDASPNPADAERFHQAMISHSRQLHHAVIAAYDFSHVQSVVDVGGGHGSFVSLLLPQYPTMRAQVLDRPDVIAGAAVRMRDLGLSDRCLAVCGDFFQDIPAKSDCYVLSFILHDWDDTACQTILQTCAQAMRPDSILLICEIVLPDHPRLNPFAHLFDMCMLHVMGGQERTAAAYDALVQSAGLRLNRLIPTATPMSILEVVVA